MSNSKEAVFVNDDSPKKNKQTLFSYGSPRSVYTVNNMSMPFLSQPKMQFCASTVRTLLKPTKQQQKNKPQTSSDDTNTTQRGDVFRHPPNRKPLMSDTKHRHLPRLVVEKLIADVLVAEQDNAMLKKRRSFTFKAKG